MSTAAATRARNVGRSRALVLLVLAGVLGICGCKKEQAPEAPKGPTTFATPEAASEAVYTAAKAGDTNALLGIFGPDDRDYVTTGNADDDKTAYQQFAADYEKMHRWSKLEDGGMVLDVGVENYPFPFPLVKTAQGQWAFSTEGAKKEILARQIGENELRTIDVLNSLSEAQQEYFDELHDGSTAHQYAQRFLSTEGKQDGLYWKVAEGEEESPLGPLVAEASAEGHERGAPFHGYFYRILKKQGAHAEGGAKDYVSNGKMIGGYAILAYPAEYRKSGVMTFLMAKDGVVHQKDLGTDTVASAKAVESYDPDDSWTVAQ